MEDGASEETAPTDYYFEIVYVILIKKNRKCFVGLKQEVIKGSGQIGEPVFCLVHFNNAVEILLNVVSDHLFKVD